MAVTNIANLPYTPYQSGIFNVSGYEPTEKPYPIRMILTGAQDITGAGAVLAGMAGYLIMVVRSKADEGNWAPGAGITYGALTNTVKDNLMLSGNISFIQVPVKGASCWTAASQVGTMYSGHMNITGLVHGLPYSYTYFYPYDYVQWTYGYYYYFFVGAYDNDGNQTDVSGMVSWSKYWYAGKTVNPIVIPNISGVDTLAPTGMYFAY